MVPRLLLISVLLICTVDFSFAQESEPSPPPFPPPQIEILKLKGRRPNSDANGEGITSYKTNYEEQEGKATVRLTKKTDLKFKFELPVGYTVFNDLIYLVESEELYLTTSDITLRLPSARTKEIFDQLRILHPDFDPVEPKVPAWVDATVDGNSSNIRKLLSESAIKERLPDFKTKTLHAFSRTGSNVFVVALKDPAKARDSFTADLELTGVAPPKVIEGALVTYRLKITNRGPDTATGIFLEANPTFSFVSVDAGPGKCNESGQHVFCKFPNLEKDRSVEFKIVERSEWNRYPFTDSFENKPFTPKFTKQITVVAKERDPEHENSELRLTTEVYQDQNQPPVVELVSPTEFQLLPGPTASVPIRVKASDPDGFIKKVEVLSAKNLAEATLDPDGEYDLIYKDAGYGRHRPIIRATDNQGRFTTIPGPEFFVNGPARVEIISPRAGTVVKQSDGELTVTVHATSASAPLKKVSLRNWDREVRAIGNDTFVLELKRCYRRCPLYAVAIDENGVETRSDYLELIIASTPVTKLAWSDGQYVREFEAGKPLKVDAVTLMSSAHYEIQYEAPLRKVEFFVDGHLVCTDNEPRSRSSYSECVWRPSPGRYKLHAVTTDVDGMVGKSEVIEVVIERP